jgi:hypothetical protein
MPNPRLSVDQDSQHWSNLAGRVQFLDSEDLAVPVWCAAKRNAGMHQEADPETFHSH